MSRRHQALFFWLQGRGYLYGVVGHFLFSFIRYLGTGAVELLLPLKPMVLPPIQYLFFGRYFTLIKALRMSVPVLRCGIKIFV